MQRATARVLAHAAPSGPVDLLRGSCVASGSAKESFRAPIGGSGAATPDHPGDA
jgi:hypothetical protein